MGTASRKTWLEKQTETVQKEVIAMDENAMTIQAMGAALKDLFGISVPVSTLGNALKIYHDTMEIRAAQEWGEQFEKLVEENPHIQAARLARTFLAQKMATAKFRDADMKASDLVFFGQGERRLDLEERRMQALEEKNRLLKEKIELDRSRVEMALAKFKKDMEEATNEAEGKIKQGKSITLDDINKIRERVFGLPAVQAQVSK